MHHSGRHQWIIAAILIGVLYLTVGLASIQLAGAAASSPMRSFWRLSAFAISVLVFAAHAAYEHFQPRNRIRAMAWHVSVAVSLGAFALALAANIHDLGSASGYRPRMLIALVAWPLLTAVPAFIVALLLATGLGMRWPRDKAN